MLGIYALKKNHKITNNFPFLYLACSVFLDQNKLIRIKKLKTMIKYI